MQQEDRSSKEELFIFLESREIWIREKGGTWAYLQPRKHPCARDHEVGTT